MPELRLIDFIVEYLQGIKDIQDIEDVEIINVPEDVEADIGIKIKLKDKNKWNIVLDKLNDIAWELFENKSELLAVYKEFE